MGMSIDKIIKNINALNAICGQKDFYDKEFKESLTVAIATMRKYQKIKEQVDIAIDKENFVISGARLIQIREIINGNKD